MNPSDNTFTNITSNWTHDPSSYDTAYHGTAKTYYSPKASWGRLGEGYYTSPDPETASLYAGLRANTAGQGEIGPGAQVRPLSIPKGFKLATEQEYNDMSDKLGFSGSDMAGPELAKLGYDGIKSGDVIMIFPQSMDKIRNKLTGQAGGYNDLGFGKDLTGGTTTTASPNTPPSTPTNIFNAPDSSFLKTILPGGYSPTISPPQESISAIPTFIQQLFGKFTHATS